MRPYYEQDGITIYAIGAGRGEWSATAAVAIGLHEAAKRVARDGSLIAFTTTSGRGIEFTQGALHGVLAFNRLLVWHKPGGRSRAMSPWEWDSVAIMLFGRAPGGISGNSSVLLQPDLARAAKEHPSELPAAVGEWLYEPFGYELGTIVLDPFMGTGRLLEPATDHRRPVIGIEIEERYCEIAAKRLSRSVMFGSEVA